MKVDQSSHGLLTTLAIKARSLNRTNSNGRGKLLGNLRAIQRCTVLRANRPVILRPLLPGACFHIGKQSGFSGETVCCAHTITIGEQCLIGANAVICDTDFHSVKSLSRRFAPLSEASAAPVHIGDRVLIGTGAIILKGVTISDDAVVGAGAVVRTDVLAGAIVAGNPMTIVGMLYKGVAREFS